eukprot:s2555_g2.t1
MMHTRWVLSFLGGHADHNWASHSTASLTNKLVAYLLLLSTRDGVTEAEIKEAASKHPTCSKRSEALRNKRKASNAVLDERGEADEAEAGGETSEQRVAGYFACRRVHHVHDDDAGVSVAFVLQKDQQEEWLESGCTDRGCKSNHAAPSFRSDFHSCCSDGVSAKGRSGGASA